VTADFPAIDEPRGWLLPVELDDVPFPVRRVFVVAGPPGGATRGDHAATCQELVVLLSGSATFEVALATTVLERPGQSLHVRRGDHVRYHLPDDASRILVLAEEPYVVPEELP